MIDFQHITITEKKTGRRLLHDFTFSLRKGDRAAMIGEEGDGKSTLLKLTQNPELILPYCEYSGTVQKHGLCTGYLEQESTQQQMCTPVRELFGPFADFGNLYTWAWKLGIPADQLESERPFGTLSGGERLKLRFLLFLVQEPDVLLLDEPTNDLDRQALAFMEQFLLRCPQPVLYVSHDETLLEKTANTIVHLEQVRRKTMPRWTVFRTGYLDYLERRNAALDKQEQLARKQKADYQSKVDRWRQIYERVDRQQAAITRQDPHGGKMLKRKMSAVKAQERRLNEEAAAMTELPDTEDAAAFFFSAVVLPRGKRVLEFHLPVLKAGENVLSRDIHLSITGPEHIAIVGKNGAGKTTLLNALSNELFSRQDLQAGLMPQDYSQLLPTDRTPVEILASNSSKAAITKARLALGSMNYTAEEMTHPAGELSGGQKAKLLLLRLILQECNVLLLDEPTRNFSPLSNPVLRRALDQFSGAWVAVTHDRKLLEICSRVYELDENGLHRIS